MADRSSGSGTGGGYTPNRKPRRGYGRGGNNSPSRGRGSTTKNSDSSPSSPPAQPPPTKIMSEETTTATGATPTHSGTSRGSYATPTSQQFPSPQAAPLSPNEFSTPPTDILETPPTTEVIEVGGGDGDVPVKSGSSATSAPTQKPEKPPRRLSQEMLRDFSNAPTETKKVFEAPQVDDPAVTAHRKKTTMPLSIDIEPEKLGPAPPTEVGKGYTSPRKSPGGFAYGLGGPLGKPAYGIKGHSTQDDEDDPWSSTPAHRGLARPSIADISREAQHFTGRQWAVLVIFGFADLFSAMAMSLQAPFYPPEAEKKGASATEYGLVFGVYELVCFLTSPIFGKYMNKLGPKMIFNAGIMTTAVSCVAFGLLDYIQNHFLFIFMSFLFRILESLGAAAFVTASFTIIACEFPESVATTFASLETFFGLGLIVGPSVGGALFELGGYILPFAVTGAGLFIIAIAATVVMPRIETLTEDDGSSSSGFGIFSILRIPGVAVATIALVMVTNSVGFLSATLEPHLRPFGLSAIQMGLMFVIYGGVYALTAPIIGWICDRFQKPIYFILVGSLLTFCAFLLIGPAPFLSMDTVLWVTAVGLVIQGLALSTTLVASFISCLTEAMTNGFPDNISTYAVVSGLWTSAVSLGAFLGPSIAGFLFDIFGFRNSTYYIFVTEALVILLILGYMIIDPKYPRDGPLPSETAPLLTPIKEVDSSGSTSVGVGDAGPSGYGALSTKS